LLIDDAIETPFTAAQGKFCRGQLHRPPDTPAGVR